MKRKVLFMTLCMSVMLSACGNNEQETTKPENTTISVDESELVPIKPITEETKSDTDSVSQNEAKDEFKNEFVSLSQMTESLDLEPFKIYCTIVKNDFYALSLQSLENKDYFLDVIIPDKEFAMNIMDMESDIEFFPEYKPASKEDAEFYNDYTWREFIEIRPGSGFFESGEENEEILQDNEIEDSSIQTENKEIETEDKNMQDPVQTDLEPQELENTQETQDEQIKIPEENTEEPENTEENEDSAKANQNDDEVQKYNYPVYELTGLSLKFGNQKSSLITNAEQLQQVLSEMGY